MAIANSGALGLADIQTEFGGSNPAGLDEYYAGGSYVPSGASGTYGAVPSSGTISVQNFYGTSAYTPVYVDDVFAPWHYTGNDSSKTIVNGVDLASGGMVWIKNRSNSSSNVLVDSARGRASVLRTDSTASATSSSGGYDVASFNNNGFTVGPNEQCNVNQGSFPFSSWSFKKQPKFFDVITWTGDDSGDRTLPHILGQAPGFIMVKRINNSGDWFMWHRGLTGLNSFPFMKMYQYPLNEAVSAPLPVYGDSSNIYVHQYMPYDYWRLNESGATYVAYVFAHNTSGGFGETGADNIISCGYFDGDGTSNRTIDIGFEPQFLIFKPANVYTNWITMDTDWSWVSFNENYNSMYSSIVYPNTPSSQSGFNTICPTSNGFFITSNANDYNGSGYRYIYIAVRRPNKAPAANTVSKYYIGKYQDDNEVNFGFPADMAWVTDLYASSYNSSVFDRVRGNAQSLVSATDGASGTLGFYLLNGGTDSNRLNFNVFSGTDTTILGFRRGHKFFDIVNYTGTASLSQTVKHNLGAVPEFIITKPRNGSGSSSGDWKVHAFTSGFMGWGSLGSIGSGSDDALNNVFGSNPNTSTHLAAGSLSRSSYGSNYIAYMFATLAGVSKVGTYTGTGSAQTIACGFGASGARFVLVKRINDTGGWHVFDNTGIGFVGSNDQYYYLNRTDGPNYNYDFLEPASGGFSLPSNPWGYSQRDRTINYSGTTYLFLAIA